MTMIKKQHGKGPLIRALSNGGGGGGFESD